MGTGRAREARVADLDKDMRWIVEPGFFEARIGASCEDIQLKKTFQAKQRARKNGIITCHRG